MMEKIISCCGLDCAACEARIATLANDDKLRAETAEKWMKQFGALRNGIKHTWFHTRIISFGFLSFHFILYNWT